MRALIGAIVVLGFAGFVTAQDKKDEKIDAKKLIGKWAPVDDKAPVTIEFTDKGKLTLSIDIGGKSEKIEGTYKLEGDKLEMVMSFGGKEQKETVTISKLTDEEMVGKDSKGKEEKFKRLKAK
ncbi:MAG: TIGR03066 family protein [Planctomycetaceae bacterium]|nr:TIGR03066 family protein [Planctomycetaceae bacterium]